MRSGDRAQASEVEMSNQCQARPIAGRRWARDDLVCPSAASTLVLHRGVEVPVCGIHGKAHARWGVDAEAEAACQWGWPGEPGDLQGRVRRITAPPRPGFRIHI